MGMLFSIAAIVVVLILGYIGGSIDSLHFIFAIIIPYLSIVFFIAGIIFRVVKWAKSPVPFRITTTTGQQKSLSWIKQNKLDNPSSAIGTFCRMALEILFFRSLFRNTKAEIKNGRKLVYGAEKWLWVFSLAFHWSFLIIVLRHFRFFTVPVPSFVPLLQSLDGFFQIGLPEIYITDILIIAGLGFLLLRRIYDKKVRYISLASDYFPLFLILSIAITGILMRYYFKTDLLAVKGFVVSLLNLKPVLSDEIDNLFYIHLFLVSTLLIYFPMSKLVHFAGVYLSPTRNLANNNRMKRHINPWNDEFKLKYHTYEEYEDEFREKMVNAGIPVDKEI